MSKDIEKRDKQEVGSSAAEQLQYSGNSFRPDVDIYTSADSLVFLVDMPGVTGGNVEINIDETDSLVIRGRNQAKTDEEPVLRQYCSGDYYRSFQLSKEYDKERVSAKLENGLLVLTIPKRDEFKPRKIEIRV